MGRHQNYFKEEKVKKQQYHCEGYKNHSEHEKWSLMRKEKRIIEWAKMPNYSYKKHIF